MTKWNSLSRPSFNIQLTKWDLRPLLLHNYLIIELSMKIIKPLITATKFNLRFKKLNNASLTVSFFFQLENCEYFETKIKVVFWTVYTSV